MINFGLEPGTRISTDIGMNAKLSELHSAAGLAMLDRIDDVVATRQAQRRPAARRDRPDTNVLYQAGAERSTWQIFHVLCPTPEMRDRCVELAPAHGIEVRTMHDPALHTHPAFECTPPRAARDRRGRRTRARPADGQHARRRRDRPHRRPRARGARTPSRKAVTC